MVARVYARGQMSNSEVILPISIQMRTSILIPVAVVAIFGGAGCAKRHDSIRPGKTTQQELHRERGEPQSARQAAHRKGALLEQYGDHVQYQVENGVVVAEIREPDPDERRLQDWLQRWKDVVTRREPVKGSTDAHGRADMQLVAPSLGMTVIYDQDSGSVRQVVRYGSSE